MGDLASPIIHEQQCFCPAPHSTWACDPDNTDPFKCGSGGGQCVCSPGDLASASNLSRQRGNIASTATCPDWATGKGTYSFVKSEWGRTTQTSGTNPATAPYGLAGDINHPGDSEMNTACAWISACNGVEECMKRCPVAMAIGVACGRSTMPLLNYLGTAPTIQRRERFPNRVSRARTGRSTTATCTILSRKRHL